MTKGGMRSAECGVLNEEALRFVAENVSFQPCQKWLITGPKFLLAMPGFQVLHLGRIQSKTLTNLLYGYCLQLSQVQR